MQFERNIFEQLKIIFNGKVVILKSIITLYHTYNYSKVIFIFGKTALFTFIAVFVVFGHFWEHLVCHIWSP